MIMTEIRSVFLIFFTICGCSGRNFTFPPPTTSLSPRPGIDFHGPLWLPRTFKETCCRRGTPEPENAEVIRNWTETASDYAVDENGEGDEGCRVFEGSFLLAAHAIFNVNEFTGYGVQCKCHQDKTTGPLDKHCRRLPPCANDGYRSFTMNGRCSCSDAYFGDLCEKVCDQGQKLKGLDGRDYCSCVPFYQGEECKDMTCLNGGVELNRRNGNRIERRCSCPPNFLGYHCEIDANRTVHPGSRFQRFGDGSSSDFFTRDISGTVFSLIMIVVLVVSMYLLMKHRMHVQNRFNGSRREQFVHPVYGMPRRGDAISPEDVRNLHFAALGIEGPPPYLASNRGRNRTDVLPPLPSYEDATKLPALRPSGTADEPRVIEDVAATSSRPSRTRWITRQSTTGQHQLSTVPPPLRESEPQMEGVPIVNEEPTSATNTVPFHPTFVQPASCPLERTTQTRRSI